MTYANLIDALRATADARGDDRGIRFYSTTAVSEYRGYAALDRRARTIAQALQARGFGPGQTALLALLPGLQWPDAAFGALYAGMTLVPAPVAGYGSSDALLDRVAGLARASEATVVIAEEGALTRLGDTAAAVLPPLALLSDLVASGAPQAWTEPAVDRDSTAFLLFTSGSTGDPKGAVGTHGTLLASVDASVELFAMDSESVMVGWAPLHHAMGLVLQAIVPSVLGIDSVLTGPEQFQRRPMFWLQMLSRHRGTTTVAGNFAFALCTQFATDEQVAELDLSSVTSLICGSEPVRPETVDAFLDRFRPAGLSETAFAPALGMTEAMLISAKPAGENPTVRRFDRAGLEAAALVPPADHDAVELVSCGRPTGLTRLVIVDPDTLQPLPDGAIGELWVSSPMVGPGYFRRPDATAESFGHRLAWDDREYLRTGDLGALVDGELYLTGRLKEIIIVRGRNIYPQDLEATARAVHPALGIGAAFELLGQPSPVGIVLEFDAEALADDALYEIAEAVRAELVARSSLPSIAVALVEQDSLPRTPTGKVRRTPTRQRLEAGELPLSYARGFAVARLT